MASDPRLAALPALRKRAEEDAKALHRVIFGHLVGGERLLAWTEAHLTLLCDLSRPASRDAVARLVAERIGWDAFDVTRAVESSTAMLAGLYRAAGLPELPRWEPAPTPAEALTLIALAVFGGAS